MALGQPAASPRAPPGRRTRHTITCSTWASSAGQDCVWDQQYGPWQRAWHESRHERVHFSTHHEPEVLRTHTSGDAPAAIAVHPNGRCATKSWCGRTARSWNAAWTTTGPRAEPSKRVRTVDGAVGVSREKSGRKKVKCAQCSIGQPAFMPSWMWCDVVGPTAGVSARGALSARQHGRGTLRIASGRSCVGVCVGPSHKK